MTRDSLQSVEELEERLSRPTPEVEATLRALDGPLLALGAGGKMGPTLARMAARAGAEVVAVSRFSDARARESLEKAGVRTIVADLLDRTALGALPDAAAVLFMAGTKFGTSASPATTWALNAGLPWLVAERFAGTSTVVFSSGNVYPLVDVAGSGATEETPPSPAGEYAWSVLARERIFQHAGERWGTPCVLYRLNYAAELRYGVTVDVGQKVRDGVPIDLSMGHVNVIWQGDANCLALRSLEACGVPATTLNVTGPETISVRSLALRFGELLGRAPVFVSEESETALLSDSRRAIARFGSPAIDIEQLVEWTAEWLRAGGTVHGKPTHFEQRDGAY